MRWGTGLLAALALVAAGCGTDAAESPGSAATTFPPATRPPGTVPPDGTLEPDPSPAAPTEPCPDPGASAGIDFNQDPGGMGAESGRLEPMLGQVLAYGQAHPDVFAGYGLTWHSANDASVVIALAGDLAGPRAELEQSVLYPDELVICGAAMNERDTMTLTGQLQRELASRPVSIGAGWGAVDVGLRPADLDLAAELVDTWGERVDVSVGSFPYPMPDPLPGSECEPPADDPLPAGLVITIVPRTGPLRSDDDVNQMQVELRNEGAERITFSTGAVMAHLLDQDGSAVSDVAHVVLPLLPAQVDIEPGSSTTLALAGSLNSCDPALGYRVPPGHYQLVATVERSTGTELVSMRSGPLPVDVA
jgi:hypothetical protein